MPFPKPTDAETLLRLDKKIEALEQQARDLARSVEMVRQQTLTQSNARIEALEQEARDLARSVERTRQQTLLESKVKTEASEQKARDLADFVDTLRSETRLQSQTENDALVQQARNLAASVETMREETRLQSDTAIATLEQQARDLAASVEAVREETRLQSDTEIAALGQQARDLAVSVEESRLESLIADRVTRRLNEELEQRVLERTEQLRERACCSTLSGDIGLALTGTEALRDMLQRCAESMVHTLNAAFARIWTLNEAENMLELQASAGMYTHLDGPHGRIPVGQFKIGLIAQERRPHLTNAVVGDPRVGNQDWAVREGMIAFAGYPLLVADRLIGVVALFARQTLSDATMQALAAVADQIALGIDRMNAEKALGAAQQRLQHVVSSSPSVLFTLSVRDGDQVQGINWISANLVEIFGYPPEDALRPEWWPQNVHPEDWDKVVVQFQADLLKQERSHYEYRLRHRDGSYRWVRSQLRLIRHLNKAAPQSLGEVVEIIGSLSDVTERKLLEDQFRQAQKMEVVGQLAGGVAHDFNNLLTVINGYSHLLLQNTKLDGLTRGFLTEILKAGERSAGLTSQLLAFSRKQVIIPRVLDLNSVIEGTEKMLQRMIGEDIGLVSTLAPDLGTVKADIGQMEQVLLNLAVNARDAMPTGGKLTIETKNVDLGDEYAQGHFSVRPGNYVLLAISDNGCGMTEEVKARVFEPFFTTKGEGKGTGLGLATVYGIVKQLEGHIGIYSEIGTGTSFKIYLPRFNAPARKSKSESSEIPTPRGTESILLVEDEPGLRRFLRQVLTDAGYAVLVAGNGIDALRIAKEYPGLIDCIVTDVVMPGLGGRQMVEQLVVTNPKVKVLYLSGYTDDAIVRHGIMHEQVPFLQKPFSPLTLAKKVREILDA